MDITKFLTKLGIIDNTAYGPKKKSSNCTFGGCERTQYTKDMCNMHYQRKRKLSRDGITETNNFLEYMEVMTKAPSMRRINPDGRWYNCATYKCKNTVYARGLCNSCYQKSRLK